MDSEVLTRGSLMSSAVTRPRRNALYDSEPRPWRAERLKGAIIELPQRTITMEHYPSAAAVVEGKVQTFLRACQQGVEIRGRPLTEHCKEEI